MKFTRILPFALLFLFAAAVLTPSCSKKSGCPTATHASDVFAKGAKKKGKH